MKLHVLFHLIFILSNVFGQEILLDVEEGILSGQILDTILRDGSYYSFKGIPYARPPVGELRFKEPQPPLPWKGVRNATAHGAICPQVDLLTKIYYPGSEDCLFLNVYTPNITPDELLPVMFFIHGGAYVFGSGNVDSFGPDFLITKEVVLVTINYRLDSLGFLCLDNDEVPGNAGLKDQLAALKWVRKNIDKFGGDPNLVTIFGQSAGGASVIYHTLSPLSNGYFKRAIAMSGSPLADWSTAFRSVDRAFSIAKKLGYDTNNKTDLLNYLQSAPVEQLVNTKTTILASEEITNSLFKLYPFTPVVEKDFGQEIFLTEKPLNLLRAEKVNEVDFMMGYTTLEAAVAVVPFEEYLLRDYNRYPEMLVPSKILINNKPSDIFNISDKIHEYFFGDQSINTTTMKEMIYYASNATFLYDINRYIRSLPNPGNNARYFYTFSLDSKRNYYGNLGAKYGISGPAHIDDLMYLFDPKALNMTVEKNSTEYELIDICTTLYTNFAKFGNPTPDSSLGINWPNFDSETLAYLNIGNTLTTSTAPDEVHFQFWKSIFEESGNEFW